MGHLLLRGIHMNYKTMSLVLIALLMVMAASGWSQELMIYPAKGQSNDQMEKDKYECYSWAKEQTGFDPMQMPTASSPAPAKAIKVLLAERLGGVAGGVGGAVIGGIAGGRKGARKGAAIGGLSGGAIGGMRSSPEQSGECETGAMGAQAGQPVHAAAQSLQPQLCCLYGRQGILREINPKFLIECITFKMEVVMNRIAAIFSLIACLGLATGAKAGDFDGSKPMLFSVCAHP